MTHTTVSWPAPGGAHTNTLPTPRNENGDGALGRSKHNRNWARLFFKIMNSSLLCARQRLIPHSKWVAADTVQVLAF